VLIRGERISFLAATQVLDIRLRRTWTATDAKPGIASAKMPALQRLLAAIRKARAISDTVVVYLHWGTELVSCPTDAQKILARQLVRAGADIVVGSHAHVLLGRGYLGRAYVDYGLGNFVFYARGGAAAQTGILMLTARGRDTTAVSWTPAMIANGIPHPLYGIRAARATAAAERLRSCTDLAANPPQ
jgi:poly-gamma-glutamate synthesis protein (capsule biosynthesis protein)